VSQGAVDGQENRCRRSRATKFFEVQKYLMLTGHILTLRLIAINEAAWQALGAKERQSLKCAIDTHGLAQDNEISSRKPSSSTPSSRAA
jgi:TRAP-type C4-dicarboxylate transport system substrate-binding protein